MAKNRKRRQQRKKPPKRSLHDMIYNKKRSTAEKIMIIFGIIIVLSMVLSLVVSLGSRGF
jgi:cell division protein FtsL